MIRDLLDDAVFAGLLLKSAYWGALAGHAIANSLGWGIV